MDALLLTAISTIALTGLVPVSWYVTWRYYGAWKGGETIPYFAPTLTLLASVATLFSIIFFVSLCTLATRATGTVILPPGLGLLLIVLAVFAPSAAMVWLLRLLAGKKPRLGPSQPVHIVQDPADPPLRVTTEAPE